MSLECPKDRTSILDRKSVSDINYLDFVKAFDMYHFQAELDTLLSSPMTFEIKDDN